MIRNLTPSDANFEREHNAMALRQALHDKSELADFKLRLSRLLEEHFDRTGRNMVWCPTCRTWWHDEANEIGGENEQACHECEGESR